jgi:hypothetical protein
MEFVEFQAISLWYVKSIELRNRTEETEQKVEVEDEVTRIWKSLRTFHTLNKFPVALLKFFFIHLRF